MLAVFILFRPTCTILIPFLFLGCSFSSKLPPLNTFITAFQTETQLYIFWVDLLDKQPYVLTVLALDELKVLSKAEYRWQDGVIREIEFSAKKSSDPEKTSQRYLIRYDSNGEAVYQDHYIYEELRPIRTSELKRIYQQAEMLLAEVQNLQKSNQHFFQGHLKNYKFHPCGAEPATWSTIEMPLDANFYPISNHHSYLIAALGDKKNNNIRVNKVIVFDENQVCFERPSFD